MNVIDFIKENKPLHNLVTFHDVNVKGIPPKLHNKITTVPVLVTKDGGILTGKDIIPWFQNLLPSEFTGMGGGMNSQNLDGNDEVGDFFALDDYSKELAPPMTKDIQNKIDMKVNDAYTSRSQN
jgi:hypothetical protein